MLQRVSDQEKALADKKNRHENNSMSRKATGQLMSAIETKAKELSAKGLDSEMISKRLGITAKDVEGLVSVSKTEEKKAIKKTKGKVTEQNKEAEEAYNSLYKRKKLPDLNAVDDLPRIKTEKSLLKGQFVSDVGGSTHQMKMPSSNTIADPKALDRAMKTKHLGEKLKENNLKRAQQRSQARDKSKVDELYGTREVPRNASKKGNSISNVSPSKEAENTSDKKYFNRLPKNSISIFETGDFERLPEKTSGEKIEPRKKGKDDWQKNSAPVNSKDIMKKMLNDFLND